MRATTKSEQSFQYFEFYVSAYFDDVAVTMLSLEAEGCYVRLLGWQWKLALKGELLPTDPAMLRRLVPKAQAEQWKRLWPELEPLFPIDADGQGRANPALHTKWLERVEHVLSKRVAGNAGGRPPKDPAARAAWEASKGERVKALRDELLSNPLVVRRGNQQANHDQNQSDNQTDNRTNNHDGTNKEPYGFAEVNHDENHGRNQPRTLELEVVTPSPPPSGGGSSPAASALRVLPGGKSNSARTGESDPFAQGEPPNLDALLERVPLACRGPVAELLHQLRSPAKWGGWITTLEQLITPDGAEVPCPITWPHVAQGLSELLLVNPPGQRITPASVEAFVAAVPRRQMRASIPAASGSAVLVPGADPFAEYAAQQAASGDPEYVEYCRTNGIPYTVKETA